MAKVDNEGKEILASNFTDGERINLDGEEKEISSALATYQNNPEFDSTDVILPRLRQAQGLTGEVQSGEAKPGQWLILGHEPMEEFDAVPLLFTRRRVLRTEEFIVLCASSDSITGVGEPGGLCADCEMNQWSEGDKGKRIPPPCQFMYSYVMYVVQAKSLALLEFKRSRR